MRALAHDRARAALARFPLIKLILRDNFSYRRSKVLQMAELAKLAARDCYEKKDLFFISSILSRSEK